MQNTKKLSNLSGIDQSWVVLDLFDIDGIRLFTSIVDMQGKGLYHAANDILLEVWLLVNVGKHHEDACTCSSNERNTTRMSFR